MNRKWVLDKVAADEAAVLAVLEKCILQSVQIVVQRLKSLSNQRKGDQCIAEIVTRNTSQRESSRTISQESVW